MSPSRARAGVCLLALPLVVVGLACENGSQQSAAPKETTWDGPRITAWVKNKDIPAPEVTARISKAYANWNDGQQTFILSLTNNGTRPETVHAIVFGTNEDIHPARRAISPPTAYAWFSLAGSKDGKLSAADIQRHWKNNAFISARGGKLPNSWQATLEPGTTKDIEASHNLDDTSPHAATKGKRLAREGFTEYTIWLVTNEGQVFDEIRQPARPPKIDRPSTAKKTPETKPAETKPEDPEELAAKQFKLALYHLEVKQPRMAQEKLQSILDNYPKTNTAKAARKLLQELKGKS